MKSRKLIIYIVISIFALLYPIGFLLGVIEDKIAFPSIFILLGFQQVFFGVFLVSKDNKILRNISFIIGTLFLLFSILYVLPTYYL